MYMKEVVPMDRLLALQRTADMCIVSSLHDGMNLVAKEYVAANVDEHGVLILSEFAGAAKEMLDAIIINPYDIDAFAEAIRESLEMPMKERKRRMRNLRKQVRTCNIFKWLDDFLAEAAKSL